MVMRAGSRVPHPLHDILCQHRTPGPAAPPGRIFLLAVTVAAYAAHRALLGIYDCFVTNIRDARRVSPAATSPSLFSGNFAAFIDAIPIAGVRRGEIDIGLH